MSKPALELPALPFGDDDVAPPVQPATRPANYTRSIFHLASGIVTLTLLHFLPGRLWLIGVSGAAFVWAWSLEATRRRVPAVNELCMRVLGAIAHPHERHRVNSSTWYITALFVLGLLAPVRATEVGVIVLAVADPAAGFVGRRYGRTRLRAGRSLEGTLGFVAAGAIAALGVLAMFYTLPWSAMVALALAGAAAGAIAELVSTRLDDNFTIPVAATAAAAAAQLLVLG